MVNSDQLRTSNAEIRFEFVASSLTASDLSTRQVTHSFDISAIRYSDLNL